MLGGWWSTFIKNGITGPLQWPRQGMTLSFALMKIFHFHIFHFSFFSCLSQSPSFALFCFSALVCRWTQQDAFFSVLVNDDPLTMNLTTVTVNCSQGVGGLQISATHLQRFWRHHSLSRNGCGEILTSGHRLMQYTAWSTYSILWQV